MQLRVLRHVALHEEDALCGIEPGGQVVEHHLERVGQQCCDVSA